MMASTTDPSSDPYHQFEADVSNLLSQTRASFTSYLRIRSLVASPTNPELLSARQELSENLSTLSDDLTDLDAAVRAVEQDPYKYGLDIEDVTRRRRFVTEAAGEVEDMKEEFDKPVIVGGGGGGGGRGGFEEEDDDQDDPVAQFEREQQVQIMREQEVQLESVSRTVVNLRDQATVLGRELEEQGEMIDDFERDVSKVESKLSKGMKDLNTFIRKNEDSASNWCIGILILVLCILLFLVLVL